jgi:hypothetical protein
MEQAMGNFGIEFAKKLAAWQIMVLILAIAGLVFVFVERTEACTIRTGPADLSVNRTADCPTADETLAPDGRETTEANVESLKQATSSGKSKPDLEITFDGNGRQNMWRDNSLTLIEGDSDLLGEMPARTWGYINDGSLVTVWRARALNTLTVRNKAPDLRFELQKRDDAKIFIVGFIRGDIARSIADKTNYAGTLKVSAKRYRSTDALVAIPIERIRTIESDEIALTAGHYIRVLVVGIA